MNSLTTYLFIAAALFIIGVFGLLQRRSLIGMLIAIELMLNGASVNFMAFNRFLAPDPVIGQVYTSSSWVLPRPRPPSPSASSSRSFAGSIASTSSKPGTSGVTVNLAWTQDPNFLAAALSALTPFAAFALIMVFVRPHPRLSAGSPSPPSESP